MCFNYHVVFLTYCVVEIALGTGREKQHFFQRFHSTFFFFGGGGGGASVQASRMASNIFKLN